MTGDASSPLFPLREELTLHAGPPAASGAPTWSLQDPVRNAYFRIDWLAFEVIARWHLAERDAIARAVRDETTLACDVADVDAVLNFLHHNELLLLDPVRATPWYLERRVRRERGFWHWLLHHYLFFRIPLLRPDRWLTSALPWVAFVYGRSFRLLTAAALVGGLVEVARQWESFRATLVDTFSWQGLAGYGVALIIVKILHELGHAFTAKRYGCRVPTMGVAFLVLWPLAYTDVNDVWKLRGRGQRIAVGAAGIATELTIAAWASLAWALLPDGVFRGVAFVLATTTWVSTLAINMSPFLRFDGYFLLSDWLDMPNLHDRAFALGRWRLRELLFGLGDPPPEDFSPERRRGLIFFAFATWLYRLVVFLGIALLVYHMFLKVLGVILGIVEVVWFVALPIWRELNVWLAERDRIRRSSRTRGLSWGVITLLLLSAAPVSFQVESQGLLQPARSYPVVNPAPSKILSVPERRRFAAGESILRLESPDLEIRALQARQKILFAEWQVAVAGVDPQISFRLPVLRRELDLARADAAGVQAEMEKLGAVAPFAGMVELRDPDLREGEWIGRHDVIADLIDPAEWVVEAYLTGDLVSRVTEGDSGRFFPDAAGEDVLDLVVERVDRDASRVLSERILAAPHGGVLLVREQGGQLIPDRALYKVRLRVVSPGTKGLSGQRRGTVIIHGSPASMLGPFFRNLVNVFVRESDF